MGVDKTQAAHDPFTEGVIPQFGDHHPLFITNYDVLHVAGTIYKDSNLTAEFTGKFNETGSKFVGTEFSNRYPSAIQTLQRLNLA
jgi:hypothetical protein